MTDLNKSVLEFIKKYTELHSEPPGLRIIADKFEWKSNTSAYKQVRILVREGHLKKLPSGRHFPLSK